jgi:hypothetical protein
MSIKLFAVLAFLKIFREKQVIIYQPILEKYQAILEIELIEGNLCRAKKSSLISGN